MSWRFALTALPLCVLIGAATLSSATDFTAWMDSIAQQHLKARREAIAAIQDQPAAVRRQQATRAKYLELIGGLPSYNGPLNPRSTGEIDGGEYIIEKVMYESFPRYFVTASVYRPKAAGRYPAILFSMGHWTEGKAIAQTIAGNLARNGFVVLAYDPVGQGERMQAYNPHFGPQQFGTTDQHILAGAQALLTGKSMASYMIHDAKRSIDYLISRPDVDPERIGATGCSGGGTITTFISGVDPRVKVAAPACYITSFELLFKGSVGDSEQSTPGFLASGLDQVDFIEMFAPKPWLILSTREDFFPLEGTKRAYEEAKRWYKLFGAEERVSWIVGPGGHGMPLEVREGLYTWMSRWLKGATSPVKEQAVRVLPEQELWSTATGQVSGMKDVRDLWQVIQSEAKSGEADPIPAIRKLVPPAKSAPSIKTIAEESKPAFLCQTLSITVEPGLEIDATLLIPHKQGKKPAAIVIETGPKLSDVAVEMAEAGAVVLALRPRGIEDRNDRRALIPDWLTNTRALLIGRNLPAMRTSDILAGVRLLEERGDISHIVGAAKGSAGVWMLMAAAVDNRLTRVWIDGTPHSFRAALDGPAHRDLHDALLPGVEWDLPKLQAALGESRVLWTDPTNWMYKVPLKGPYRYRLFEEGNAPLIQDLLAVKPAN